MFFVLFMVLSGLPNDQINGSGNEPISAVEQVFCPVLSNERIDLSIYTDYEGQRVYFCCQKCRKDFIEDPAPYLAHLTTPSRDSQSGAAVSPSQDELEDHGHSDETIATHADEEQNIGHELTAPEHDHAADHGQPTGLSRVIRFLGKFHPVAVHFPIALILAAAVAELLAMRWRLPMFTGSARYLTLLGGLSAVGTAALGWAAGAFSHYPGELATTLVWHRWLGTATGIMAILAAVLSEWQWRDKSVSIRRNAYRISLFAAAALAGIAGHFGAMLIYGWDHFAW